MLLIQISRYAVDKDPKFYRAYMKRTSASSQTIAVNNDYLQKVGRTAVPLCGSGILAYLTGLIETGIVGYISFDLLGAIGISALLIALPMSGLMAIISANQAIFAKLYGRIVASQSVTCTMKLKRRSASFLIISIITAALLGIFAFVILNYATPFVLSLIVTGQRNDALQVIANYVIVAKFSLFFVPITLSIKGYLNGANAAHLTLKITMTESVVRLTALIAVASIALLYVNNHAQIVSLIAGTILVADTAGLATALLILSKSFPEISSARVGSNYVAQTLAYLYQAKGYLTFSSLQNVLSVSANFTFLSTLGSASPVLAGQFRTTSSIFNFNRLIFNGASQANAIVAVQEVAVKGMSHIVNNVIKTTNFILLTSLVVSCLLSAVSIALAKMAGGGDLLFMMLIALAFVSEGLALIFFRLLLYFGYARSAAIAGVPILMGFLIIAPIYLDLDALSFGAVFFMGNSSILIAYRILYSRLIFHSSHKH